MHNTNPLYVVHSGLSKEEVQNQLYLDRDLYEESANKRFSLLDCDYPLFAKDTYKYPLHGNWMLSQAIGKVIKDNLKMWQEKDSITIADLGAAGGAITTLFVLQELKTLGLLDKAKLILVDISKDALEATKSGKSQLPVDYFREMKWEIANDLPKLQKKLQAADLKVQRLYELGNMEDQVDISLCGFTHHHLNFHDKQLASEEMERITRPGGVIGVVDEHFSYEDYIAWIKNQEGRKNTRGEIIPIAIESFIDLEELQSFYKQTKIVDQGEERYFHYFVGIRQ
jgi:SAM-dependent methyltransferase